MTTADDREQEQTNIRGKGRPVAAWHEILGVLTPVLAVGAILLYGYLSIAYDNFYQGLGIDPNDVGFEYTGVLARSSGFVVVYLTAVGTLAVIPTILTFGRPEERRKNRARFIALLAMIGIILVLLLIDPLLSAGDAARDVREGKPVGPIHLITSPVPPFPISRLPVLAIHAGPAMVEPAGKLGEAPAVERLRGRKVLYLGQAGGTVVLYDPEDQEAVYVSASSILLHVSNCNTKRSPDPACSQLQLH
jgi:amino acid transporter